MWISTIETNMDKHASQLQLTRATRVGRQSIRDMWPRVSVCRTCQNVTKASQRPGLEYRYKRSEAKLI